jgi:peroxiredoxin
MLKRVKTPSQKARLSSSAVLAPGKLAPDFALSDATGERISLRDYRGQPVVLVFYPADFSPVCGDQLVLYISVDGKWCHRAFTENRNLRFPLLSDFEPKGAVAQLYGVYDTEKGVAQRALFVLDAEGIIRWSHVSPSNVNPGADGILRALEAL